MTECVRDSKFCLTLCRQGTQNLLVGPFSIVEPTAEIATDETTVKCKENICFTVKSADIYLIVLFELYIS